MFSGVAPSKDAFLNQARTAREIRQNAKSQNESAIKIQRMVRGWLCRIKLWREVRLQFDAAFSDTSKLLSIDAFKISRKVIKTFDPTKDKERLEIYCRYLIASLEQESPKLSCVGVALNKEHAVSWINHLKKVLELCLCMMEQLKPESPHDSKQLTIYLHLLISFTSITAWKILNSGKLPETLKNGMQQLCNNVMGHLVSLNYYPVLKTLLLRGLCGQRRYLKHAAVSAIMTLSLRPLLASEFSSRLLTLYILNIFSVPGFILHLQAITPESVSQFKSSALLTRILEFLNAEQNTRIVFHTLEATFSICLLGNIIQLTQMEEEESLKNLIFPNFVCLVCRLLEHCQRYVQSKQSNLTQWHPILGWFSSNEKSTSMLDVQETTPLIKQQLSFLWTSPLVQQLTACLPVAERQEYNNPDPRKETPDDKNLVTAFKKALGNSKSSKSNQVVYPTRKLGSPEVTQVALVASMYQTALSTLTQMRMDILTALSCRENFLPNLWHFISSLGPNHGLKTYLDLLSVDSKRLSPECQMLHLFCEGTTHFVTVLDDLEMYEEQKPFTLLEFCNVSSFLNHFMFKAIWNGLADASSFHSYGSSASNYNLFHAAHTLLMVVYRRDCRRPFAPKDHWLVKDVKSSLLVAELERGRQSVQLLLQKMPHVIPLEDRVLLFRKYISNEKNALGLTETASASPQSILITVHRLRMVEDSFRQLADLPMQLWKGIIRVKFINLQGLDEAGIDQDGVFKEFLEETVRKLFDPSLNLFRSTKDQRLYPSPTSYLTDNHLHLFEFAGKLLGKAVYEGSTVDVPLASFFLSQVLGQTHSVLYSALDELPSLDPELYRSLTYIKRYEGDVSDLSLTFSVDDDFMGKLITQELRPGGKAIPVTNENKISYIHQMAHFRMHTQIRDQTSAFLRGFRTLVNPEWLSLFSTPEIQRLIADDKEPINFKDLRKHTQYYGGFHDNHRVISWLWDILDNDLNDEEKRLFLKFVTSCSKPPLLGFAHLQPPFSIRCVEVNEDEDNGDTIGSVIRGFFTIRKRDPINRLPTSSTCFNLLKLPNYQRRSTLKEKLRYAITSNTGFELS
ncbi:ubiquitin-protein ligase E3B-like [Daphnia pulex]|uniref:ubiquitin-protein ligase E3B-like n=1 Tax=Daphnia pulex TaxID=6669 RepID=UPI001EDE43C7|nr:ubiquitin-protein ligase E3B-like [Daphnia pulex]